MRLPLLILGLVFSAVFSSVLSAQNSGPVNWDAVMDQYEVVCEYCLQKKSVKEIKAQTVKLEDMLKCVKGRMNESQMQRFEDIRSRYSGLPALKISGTTEEKPVVEKIVVIDTIRKYEHIQVTDTLLIKEVLASVDINMNVSKSDTLYHVIQVEERVDSSRFLPAAPPVRERKGKFFVQALAPVSSSMSFGLAAGWGGRAGFWLSAQNNFMNRQADYSLQDYSQHIWTSGDWALRRFSYCAGGYYSPYRHLALYAGAGYGEHIVLWKDISGKWAEIGQRSSRGISYKAGVTGVFDRVIFGVGAGGICDKLECELSLGIRF